MKVTSNATRVIEATKDNINIGTKKALNLFSNQIKNSFIAEYENGQKSGRKYGKHIASAPNETPAKISGNLGRNFRIERKELTLDVIDSSGYGAFLEFGTKNIVNRLGVLKAITINKQYFKAKLIESKK